jgi:phosphomannomutase
MISASHNAYHDNGIKLFGPDGYKLSDEIELEIEALMEAPVEQQLASPAEPLAAPSASMVSRRATSNLPSAPSAIHELRACASCSIAPTVRPTRWRLRCFGNWAPK